MQTPENTYGLLCLTNLPHETFVYITREHVHFGLSVKEIKAELPSMFGFFGTYRPKVNSMSFGDMFHDLELEDDCAEVINRFPGVVDIVNSKQNFPSKIKMGTKALEKGKKSKAAARQSNCSSMHPLHPIRENGEIMDMEEQMPELVDTSDNEMPELVDISENEISSTRENLQGSTTQNQRVNVTFEDENSRNTLPNPQVLMKNLRNLQIN